ncbi:hypothetical protein Tco_1168599 [Tanacetum coccineum]
MDPTSSLGRICLGENVYGSSSEKNEGHGDWNAPEYTDTAGSKEKKVTKALSVYKMETDEVSEWYIAPCFVNGLEEYDGEINLALDENLISNEYAVKLCFDYEVKKGNKVVKKELIVPLKGELYFVKFIINPKEDDVEPGALFEDDSEKIEKSIDDWDQLLNFNFDDIPRLDGEELPPFVYKIGKSSRNKKRAMDNLNLFYPDIRPPSSTGRHLTQEEAAKEALALRNSQKFALLEEVRPVLETMAYLDKYKKVLDEIWKDKVELDGMIVKEEEDAINKVKEPIGILINVLCQVGVTTIIAKFLILDIPIDRDAPIVVGRGFIYTIGGIVNTPERLFSTFDGICHQTFRATRSDVLRTAKSDSNDEQEYEIKRNKFGAPIYGPKLASYLNCNDPAERSLALQAVINPFRKISVWKKAVSFLGSLLVPLQHVDWKPDYKGCYTNKVEVKGQWRAEIKATGPYGNIFVQGFTAKKTSRKLSKYHNLSDIMSPNWFIK